MTAPTATAKTTIVIRVDAALEPSIRLNLAQIEGVDILDENGVPIDPWDEDYDPNADAATRAKQEKWIKDSLTRAFAEVREAHAKGEKAGRPIQELLDEL